MGAICCAEPDMDSGPIGGDRSIQFVKEGTLAVA